MLQRIQSIWLLLAAAFDAVTFRFPFYSGDWKKDSFVSVIDLNAKTTIWLSILAVFTGLLAFITVFLYNNRKLQLKLCFLGVFLAVILLIMYIIETGSFNDGNVAIWAVFYFAILGCFILAARGIWKDQKLIKSMDRLR